MKQLLLLFALCGYLLAHGYDFKVNGIAYKVNDDGVSVTVVNDSSYTQLSGQLRLYDKVFYQGKEYAVTVIGRWAFFGCASITSVVLPNTIVRIDACAFERCKGLTNVVWPNSIKHIGQYAFDDCTSLEGDLVIPNSVLEIADVAFYGCSSITRLFLGENLRVMSSHAFTHCESLKEIHVNRFRPPYLESDDSRGFNCHEYLYEETIYDDCTLYVPKGSAEFYMVSGSWGLFTHIVEEDSEGNVLIQPDVDRNGVVDVDDLNHVINVMLRKE